MCKSKTVAAMSHSRNIPLVTVKNNCKTNVYADTIAKDQ